MTTGQSPELQNIFQIQTQVTELATSVSKVAASLERLEQNLLASVNGLQQSMNTLIAEQRQERVLQRAYNELAEARRLLEQDFGIYRDVRRLAEEVIYIVDSGFISRSVIMDVTERLTISTPRYWLAPTVLAVAAWLDDDPERFQNAIGTALRLDRGRTALFMALLLRHQGRDELMREWIACYLASLVPTDLPTDFAVVFEAVAGGTLGADSAPQLVWAMQTWYDEAKDSREAEAVEVEQWVQNLLGLSPSTVPAGQFPVLARLAPSGTMDLFMGRREAASAVATATEYFRNRFKDGSRRVDELDTRISSLLRQLGDDTDPAEEQLRRTIRRSEIIIEGFEEEAADRQIRAEQAGRNRSLNILSLITQAALPADRRGQATVSELLAIVICQQHIAAAAARIHDRHHRPTTVEIRIDGWLGHFSCADDAETTRDALTAQSERLLKDLTTTLNEQTTQNRKRLHDRVRGRRRLLGALGAILTITITAAVSMSPAAWVLVPGIWLAAVLTAQLDRRRLLRHRLHRATEAGEQKVKDAENAVTQAARELATLFDDERSAAANRQKFHDYLLALTPEDAYKAIRYDIRGPNPTASPMLTPSDASAATSNVREQDARYARGFPEWPPGPPRPYGRGMST